MESELQNSYQFSSPNFIDPNVLAKNQTTRKKEEKKKKKVRAAGYHGIENRKQKQQPQSIFSNLINSNDVADMTPPLDLTGSCLSYFLGQGMSAILVSVPRLSVSYICFKFRVKCENSLCRSICPLLLRHHYSHSSCPGIQVSQMDSIWRRTFSEARRSSRRWRMTTRTAKRVVRANMAASNFQNRCSSMRTERQLNRRRKKNQYLHWNNVSSCSDD